MVKQIFVSPFNGNWKVKTVGNQKAAAICETKAEAIKVAIQIAKNNHLELTVQNLDGTIGIKNSYGADSRETKG